MFMLFAEGLVPRPELLAVSRPERLVVGQPELVAVSPPESGDHAAADELVLAGR